MTREEAIYLLKNTAWLAPSLEPVDEAIDMAIEALQATSWIPCSERLPEETGIYLCTVVAPYRNPREMLYAPQLWADESDNATWRSTDGIYVYDWFVEAWMPLPEPYREDSER